MRHSENCARLSSYVVICLMLSCTFVSYATAQDKVVVVPLMSDEATAPAPVEKTGQTISYAVGDDGGREIGVVWPNPRFSDHGNGTVTDKLTGLIWLKAGACARFYFLDIGAHNNRPWSSAIAACNQLVSGYCGLGDGSNAGDWRLPNRKELDSLIDLGQAGLSPSSPLFASTVGDYYWSSSTYAILQANAWRVSFGGGMVYPDNKSTNQYVRCVKGGN